MRSVVEIGASVPAFLGKLWKLVNDSETNHLISWSPGGKTFVIKNQADFARELLPLYYKHNNMASFIRQLNMYGFHKITSVENGGLRYDKDEIEFSHPCFMRGHSYLLEHIKRKIANPKAIVASSENGEKILLKPEMMNKVLADVKQMKGKQESLDAKFSAMKQENEALWREVAILRQKHIKQQQIVNNLIQFLMSLVQPTRAGNSNNNGVGVKRPYQLMINNAAHNNGDTSSSRAKNMKLAKDATLLEELIEDNLEDGPTIHELAHDDVLQNESSPESVDPVNYITINIPGVNNAAGLNEGCPPSQYEVTLEDGEEIDAESRLRAADIQPIVTSPSPILLSPSGSTIDRIIAPSTSKPKAKSVGKKNLPIPSKNMISSNSYINPTADLRLPAEIFASDDSVSDAGIVAEDVNPQYLLQDNLLNATTTTSKDKMFGGINIKIEKPETEKTRKKSKQTKETQLNLQNIKTEMQEEPDWTMSLATVNNNSDVNRLQAMNRRQIYNKNLEDLSAIYGTNSTGLDDHLESMQSDLDSLRELLRSDSYALDPNTLMGLFGTEDPFYGFQYNPIDDRPKDATNAMKQKSATITENQDEELYEDINADGSNQLISYTGNIPDFEDISIEFDGENSQECVSPALVEGGSSLNTPQAVPRSPGFPPRRA